MNDLIGPLLGGTKDFRSDEAALEDLIGAADVKWFHDRERLAPTHDWGPYSSSPATELRQCLIAAVLRSPEGEKVFAWLGDKREATAPGSPARGVADHTFTHVLAFVHDKHPPPPPGFDDEDLGFLRAQGLPTAKMRSLAPGHAELASQVLQELYPGGTPEAKPGTQYGGGRSHHLGSEGARGSGLSLSLFFWNRTDLQRTSSSRSHAEIRIRATVRGFGPESVMAPGQAWVGTKSASIPIGDDSMHVHTI